MNLHRLTIALVVVICIAAPAQDHNSPLPAAQLIHEVVANELTDRGQQQRWMYVIEKREEKQTLTEEQVETKDGPLYRVLAIDGKPLDPDQRQQDNARIDRLLHDPSEQLKLKRAHDEDEQKLQELMRLMSDAFLYDYDGVEGNLVRLKFRPNPNYNPPTYEARVAHSLAGTILIDSQRKRLAKLSGRLMDRVDMEYWGTSTAAAQSRLRVYRSGPHDGRLPCSIFNYPDVCCSSRLSASSNTRPGRISVRCPVISAS